MFSLVFIITPFLVFLLFNELLKRTNWYKNKFIYLEQIQSPKTGLDIINLGSNPALFAFDFTKYNGQNWSTGTQAPDMDREILKKNVQRLKKGAYVLIPIVPFSSISTYLDHNKPMFQGVAYYTKFAKYMPHLKNRENRGFYKGYIFSKYPLLFSIRSLIYIVKDVKIDDRTEITSNHFNHSQFRKIAMDMVNWWKVEFDINDIDAPISGQYILYQKECAAQVADICRFSADNGLIPVIVIPPISNTLSALLSNSQRKNYTYSFIEMINEQVNVRVLDYLNTSVLLDDSLYFHPLFLNKKGREKFTSIVISDLN